MLTIIVLIVSIVIGVPVALSVIVSGALVVYTGPLPDSVVAQRIFGGLDSSALLAVPLFVLAGEIMNASGITKRIIEMAKAFVGASRASLGLVNVWSSVIFGGISGSAVADASALGRVFIPEMQRTGYPPAYAAALTAASSVIGPLIPPSIPVVIYAVTTSGVSVPGLFLAGVGPGLVMAICLSAAVMTAGAKYERAGPRLSVRTRLGMVVRGFVPVSMPLFIVLALLTGFATPTEAAGLAVLYALAIGFFIYRTLKFSQMFSIMGAAMRDSSVVLVIIAAMAFGNWLLTLAQVPQTLSGFLTDGISDPMIFLVAVVMFLLVIGCFLEGAAAILILVPILHPLAISYGIDPIHFAMIVISTLMVGLVTPPMGMCLFVVSSISGIKTWHIVKYVWPMLLIQLVAVGVIVAVPQISTSLPNFFGFG